MGKGSGRRPQEITDKQMEDAWNAIFAGHPTEDQFETVKKDIVKRKEDVIKEDGYGNVLPKPNDPDRFVDDTGDA
jgi:hypothetical protein